MTIKLTITEHARENLRASFQQEENARTSRRSRKPSSARSLDTASTTESSSTHQSVSTFPRRGRRLRTSLSSRRASKSNDAPRDSFIKAESCPARIQGNEQEGKREGSMRSLMEMDELEYMLMRTKSRQNIKSAFAYSPDSATQKDSISSSGSDSGVTLEKLQQPNRSLGMKPREDVDGIIKDSKRKVSPPPPKTKSRRKRAATLRRTKSVL